MQGLSSPCQAQQVVLGLLSLHSRTKGLCSGQSHDLWDPWGSQLTQSGICPNLLHSDVDSWLSLLWVPLCGRGKSLWAFIWGRGSCPGPFQGLSQLPVCCSMFHRLHPVHVLLSIQNPFYFFLAAARVISLGLSISASLDLSN